MAWYKLVEVDIYDPFKWEGHLFGASRKSLLPHRVRREARYLEPGTIIAAVCEVGNAVRLIGAWQAGKSFDSADVDVATRRVLKRLRGKRLADLQWQLELMRDLYCSPLTWEGSVGAAKRGLFGPRTVTDTDELNGTIVF